LNRDSDWIPSRLARGGFYKDDLSAYHQSTAIIIADQPYFINLADRPFQAIALTLSK